MSIGADIRTYLLTQSDVTDIVGNDIFQNRVPGQRYDEGNWPAGPFVYYIRRGKTNERALGDEGPQPADREFFDIECTASDITTSLALAAAVRDSLDNLGPSVAFGGSTIQGIFVQDHDDAYVPRNRFDDEGRHVAALDVEIIPLHGGT